jgi:hypothetical protein
MAKSKVKSKINTNIRDKSIRKNSKLLSVLSNPMVATIGTTMGTLLAKEVGSYVYKNYGKYAIGYNKEKKCFNDHDYDQLLPTYQDKLTFKFYMDNKLYNIRKNYEDDIKNGKITKYNEKYSDSKIESLHDYIANNKFNHLRPRVSNSNSSK